VLVYRAPERLRAHVRAVVLPRHPHRARRRRCRAGPASRRRAAGSRRRAARRVAQAARWPFWPRRIGLSRAARQQLRATDGGTPGYAFRRRFVTVETAVQGPAPCRASRRPSPAGAEPDVDVIVVTRGGGSLEDLLPFSDESLCRAIAACGTPVVSAIGTSATYRCAISCRRARIHSDRGSTADRARPRSRAREPGPPPRAPPSARGAARCERPAWGSRRSPHDPSSPVRGCGSRRRRAELADRRVRLDRLPRTLVEARRLETISLAARLRALSPQATLERGYAIALSPPPYATPKSSSGGRPSSCGSPRLGVAAREEVRPRWPLRRDHLRAGSRRARSRSSGGSRTHTSLDEALRCGSAARSCTASGRQARRGRGARPHGSPRRCRAPGRPIRTRAAARRSRPDGRISRLCASCSSMCAVQPPSGGRERRGVVGSGARSTLPRHDGCVVLDVRVERRLRLVLVQQAQGRLLDVACEAEALVAAGQRARDLAEGARPRIVRPVDAVTEAHQALAHIELRAQPRARRSPAAISSIMCETCSARAVQAAFGAPDGAHEGRSQDRRASKRSPSR